MLFALALCLIPSHVHAQTPFSAEKIALIQPVSSSLPAKSEYFVETSLPLTPASSDISIQPFSDSASTGFPEAPAAAEPVPITAPSANAFLRPGNPLTVSVNQLRAEERQKQRLWIGLGIAEHSAATFDAWTTRRAIANYGAQELNPLLRPFAGNASLYAAIQVGPAVMDYVGRKMMYSRHSWVRRMWWVPQTASFTSSLFCGAHNLSVR
jgi:hypothetical protein